METKLIEEITSFTSKELLSKFKNFKHNKGSRIVDDAFIAKLKNRDKQIIIDLEMEKNFSYSLTEKFYDYGNGLRRANEFMETWVIALCMDKSKKPITDKSSQSYIIQKDRKTDIKKTLDYLHIFEIYLNDLYKNLDKDITIFEDEVIKEEGKEWIKLLTITLWTKYYKSDICYILPSNITFNGKYIKKAIEKLSNINDLHKLKIETEIRIQKENEEDNNRIIEEKYEEGYKQGETDGFIKGQDEGYKFGQAYGYQIGQDEGFKKGQDEGFKKGQDEGFKKGEVEGYNKGKEDGFNNGFNNGQEAAQLQLLDFFFQQLLNGKSVENIEIIGNISFNRIKNRYGNYDIQTQNNFFGLLYSKNLLTQ